MAICDACAANVPEVTAIASNVSLCEACLSVHGRASGDTLEIARTHRRTGSWSLDIELADRDAAHT